MGLINTVVDGVRVGTYDGGYGGGNDDAFDAGAFESGGEDAEGAAANGLDDGSFKVLGLFNALCSVSN